MRKSCNTKYAVIILIFSLLLCSCTSTVQLTSISEAEHKIGDSSAKIIMQSGEIYDGKKIKFEKVSVFFINEKSDSLMQFRSKEIKSVYVKDCTRGMFEGLWLGAALGYGGGYASTAHLNDGGDEGMGKYFGRLILGTFGGLTGMTVGLIKGHEYFYVLPQDSTTKPPEDTTK